MTLRLTIDGREANVEQGATLLAAARSLGIAVPTLCHLEGHRHFTSCMVCLVKDRASGRLLPACSAPAAEGMDIATGDEEAVDGRRTSLDLLLSEHAGDCDAPCTRTCPAHLDIPGMIRLIDAGRDREALALVKETIALPAVLGRICPAPCEKACRRAKHDAGVSICLLKRFVADEDLAGDPWLPGRRPASGKAVAVVGAGPAGLSAAWYLAVAGHACTVFDERERPGGQLVAGVPEQELPREVLARESGVLERLGVRFRLRTRVGREIGWDELRRGHDAVVLATGRKGPAEAAAWGLAVTDKGITVAPHTFRASDPAVFAGGEAVQPGRLAIRSCAAGRSMAAGVDQFLSGVEVRGLPRRFDARLGNLQEGELAAFLEGADPSPVFAPAGGPPAGYTPAEARRESRRCLGCDCRKAAGCRLRELAETCGATQGRFTAGARRRFSRLDNHPEVVFEPGKCILCGICVRIAEAAGFGTGLALLGRGFDATVGVPFGDGLVAGLGPVAGACVRSCPTGALAAKRHGA